MLSWLSKGGGRQSNQVGLIDLHENISIVKSYVVLSKSGGAEPHSPTLSTAYVAE